MNWAQMTVAIFTLSLDISKTLLCRVFAYRAPFIDLLPQHNFTINNLLKW